MQGRRSILDSFPDTIDLNQGSVSGTSSINHSASWDSLLNPVENRMSNYMLSSGERSVGCTSTSSHNTRSSSGWDAGESSYVARDRMHGDDLKIGQGCSASAYSMHGHGSESSGVLRSECGTSYGGNHVFRRALNMPGSGSGSNLLCDGHMGNTGVRLAGTSSSRYWPGRVESHESLTFGASSNNPIASSSSSGYLIKNDEESGSSFGPWGPSGKRKALESSHAQLHAGGSSSSHLQAENFMWDAGPAHHNSSGSITTSSPVNWCYSSHQLEQLNPRNGVDMRGKAPEIFPVLNITGVADSVSGDVSRILNPGHQEPDSFSFPIFDLALISSGGSSCHQPSRSLPSNDSSMLMNSCNPLSHPQETHVPGYTGSMLPYRWNGSFDLQCSSSLNSSVSSGDKMAEFRDEQSVRSSLRNNPEVSAFVTSSGRSFGQDSPMLNFASGDARSSRGLFPSSRSGSSLISQNPSTGCTVHPNMTEHNQQGMTEYAPWTLSPLSEADYGRQRGQFPVIPSTSSSSLEAAMPSSGSRSRQHQYSRSAFLMDAPSDAISGRRAIAVDIEGRHRLIRQVRNAVRRSDNWRAQDSTVFDPSISGVAELHDRHSDMRLDVDNMSYEELLALEERIGNVSTGLSEEIIMRSMKQRKYEAMEISSNSESCCICQEEYVGGDDIGTSVCGHEFHTSCIKQWLLLKNLCPICKMTALET